MNQDTPVMVYVVGRVNLENHKEWEFQGVYDSRDKAVEACEGPDFFVGPVQLNKRIPIESQPWPGAFWPHLEES